MTEGYETIPLTPMRRVIAARMTETTRSVPHFRLTADIGVDALTSLRREFRAQRPEEGLSLNDLLIKACAKALMDTPAVNVQWAERELHEYRSADISVVIALEGGGLATPILRHADSKSIWDISREVRELTARATKNALRMDEIVGGSFSLSNLGMYGVDQFDAIVNSPQCAILAIGAAKPRAIVSPEGDIRVATILRATLSVDHRAINGAAGAAFLNALRHRIEQPGHLRPEGV